MSLVTPLKVEKLRMALHAKAKEEPEFRFYQLYDKLYRADVLEFAYRLSRSKKGAAGIDGETFEQIESEGLEGWLGELTQELKQKTYKADPLKREWLEKPDGTQRPLGIIYSASALIGFGWGLMYTLAPVVLTRLSSPEDRVQMFSLYAVFLMAGFGLSPVFASLLESRGYNLRDVFRVVAVCCTVSGTLFLLISKSIGKYVNTGTPDNRSRLSAQAVKSIFGSRAWVPVVMVCLGASVFAGVNNFQTVIAASEGLNYADYFLVYTITTVVCRVAFARDKGGAAPYLIIGILQSIMSVSVLLFLFIDGSQIVYIACAILFAIGYGASYSILAAMAANDADEYLLPQTLQLFSLTYFVGIFGFPFIAGWLIVDFSISILLILVAIIAAVEASLAFARHRSNLRLLLD